MNLSLYGITWISLFFWIGLGFVWGILVNDVYKYYSQTEKTKTAVMAIGVFVLLTLIFILFAGDIPAFLYLFAGGIGMMLSLLRSKILLFFKPRLPKQAIRVLR